MDTCCAMMLIDERDKLRIKHRISRKKAEACIARNHGRLCISMPALGEVLFKERDINRDYSEDLFKELNRLIDDKVFELRFIDEMGETFAIAREIMRRSRMDNDDRNVISSMDALILSTAIADPESSVFYTNDVKLMSNQGVMDIIAEYRDKYENNFEVRKIDNLLR